MADAFLYVVIGVGIVGVLGAVLALAGGRRTWESYGRDGLFLDSDASRPGATGPGAVSTVTPTTPAALAERDLELRQMLQARNARRARRGEPPLDVEAELVRLTAPSPPSGDPASGLDPELLEEIRALVGARNARRARRGEPPLDVDAEVERQIRELPR